MLPRQRVLTVRSVRPSGLVFIGCPASMNAAEWRNHSETVRFCAAAFLLFIRRYHGDADEHCVKFALIAVAISRAIGIIPQLSRRGCLARPQKKAGDARPAEPAVPDAMTRAPDSVWPRPSLTCQSKHYFSKIRRLIFRAAPEAIKNENVYC